MTPTSALVLLGLAPICYQSTTGADPYAGQIHTTEHDVVAERYAQISDEYLKRLATSMRNKESHVELRRIGEWRSQQLVKLLAGAQGRPSSDLSPSDLSALAGACELLRRREECISFAQLAVERDPRTESAYKPLIRSLLNVNRTSEAIEVLERAKTNIPQLSKWRGMHYFVFLKYRRSENWDAAIPHLYTYMELLLSSLERDPAAAKLAIQALGFYCTAHNSAGLNSECRRRLGSYYDQTTASLAVLEGRYNAREKEANQVARCLVSLYELRCELSLLLDHLDLHVHLIDWLESLSTSGWDEPEDGPNDAGSIRNYFISYVRSVSHHVKDWDAMNQALVRLAQESATFGKEPIAELKVLSDVVKDEQRALKLVGTVLSPLDDVKWSFDAQFDASLPTKRPFLLVLCHGQPISMAMALRAVHDSMKMVDFSKVDLIWVYSSLGYENDEFESERFRFLVRGAKGEQEAGANVRSIATCSIGQIGPDAPLIQMLGESAVPLMVLVDTEGEIRSVITGCGKRKADYLKSQVIETLDKLEGDDNPT